MSAPACMTDAEWADWQRPIQGRSPTGHPCFDCPRAFHAEQLAAGTCDGIPEPNGGRRLLFPASVATERRRAQWRAYRRRKAAAA